MKTPWCAFCTCDDCQNGTWAHGDFKHAKTESGAWICEVCFEYDECVRQARKVGTYRNDACDAHTCSHRPKLVTEWVLGWPEVVR